MAYGVRAWTPSRVITRATTEKGEFVERRRHARVKMELPARYLTPDGEEAEGVTVDFSPAGVRFRAAKRLSPGVEIIAYVRDLGRLQGRIVRTTEDGFVLAIAGSERKAERLAEKIAWLKPEGVQDRRLFPRVSGAGAMIEVRGADGRNQIAPIIDMSAGGIAFETELALKVGDRIEIGDQTGVVVRVFKGGVAAKFI